SKARRGPAPRLDGAFAKPELGQLAVLHLLRRCRLPQPPVHGLGPGHRRHGKCRQDQARRTGQGPRQDRVDEGRRGRQMMKRIAAALVLFALAAPAAATESIVCASEDKAASIDVLVGLGLDVVSIARATIEAKGKTWATDATGEQKIAIGQAF